MNYLIFVNATKTCNIDCPRCYIKEENRKSKDSFDLTILKRFFDTPEFINASSCTLIWQGGEPSIKGESFFRSADAVIPSFVKQRMVTNLYNLPNWLIKYSREKFDSQLETTYAIGRKYNLKGSSKHYQQRFISNMKKAVKENIMITGNVELNDETLLAGPENFFNIIKSTENDRWEFDVSINFLKFFENENFNEYGSPILPTSISYKNHSKFLKRLIQIASKDKYELTTSWHENIDDINDNHSFNNLREREFITINPDGTITTNPLYSDIKDTYLGNINTTSIDDILRSKKRIMRIKGEINRLKDCIGCNRLVKCKGGSSYINVFDGSGECAGFKEVFNNA